MVTAGPDSVPETMGVGTGSVGGYVAGEVIDEVFDDEDSGDAEE